MRTTRISSFPTAITLLLVATVALACGEVALDAKATPAARPSAPTATPVQIAAQAPPTPTATAIAPTPTVTAAPATPTATPPPPTSTPSPTTTPVAAATVTVEPLASGFPYTVIDSSGKEVTFERPPERIVAFDSAAVETLFAIGEGHRIVGTHSFVSYPAETADIPRVGDAFNMNIEAIVALNPDLVFIFFEGSLPNLERVGLKVLYHKSLSEDFRKVADNTRMWGHIVGSPDEGERVAAEFEARVDAVEEAMSTQPVGPSVFQDEGQLWTPGSDTLMSEVFALLKLQNIADDVSGYVQLSPEAIVDRAPEIVIVSYGDTISDNPGFKDVPAVKNNRVYVPESDALSIAGPRYVVGIEALAKWVYPDLFK